MLESTTNRQLKKSKINQVREGLAFNPGAKGGFGRPKNLKQWGKCASIVLSLKWSGGKNEHCDN